jgi:hypothetical protein
MLLILFAVLTVAIVIFIYKSLHPKSNPIEAKGKAILVTGSLAKLLELVLDSLTSIPSFIAVSNVDYCL